MPTELQSQLEQSAAETGVSFNAEVLRRVEQSFTIDGPGGPLVSMIFRMAQAAFVRAGQQCGGDDWLADPTSYRVGMLAVIDALTAAAPLQIMDVPADELRLYEEWSTFLMARDARQWAGRRSLASGGGAPPGAGVRRR